MSPAAARLALRHANEKLVQEMRPTVTFVKLMNGWIRQGGRGGPVLSVQLQCRVSGAAPSSLWLPAAETSCLHLRCVVPPGSLAPPAGANQHQN